jgi:hypothetical protein
LWPFNYLPESHLECHRGHLRVDDYYVKVLTLKEASAQSFPVIFKELLAVDANYHVVTEWKKEDSGKTRRAIQAKRRRLFRLWTGVHIELARKFKGTLKPGPHASSKKK